MSMYVQVGHLVAEIQHSASACAFRWKQESTVLSGMSFLLWLFGQNVLDKLKLKS